MYIGVDIGSSATKIVAIQGGNVVFTLYETTRAASAGEILRKLLADKDTWLQDVTGVALTGVGSERDTLAEIGLQVVKVPEVEAIGVGGTWLSGRGDAVITSIGTGTALVLSRQGLYTHIGGTGIGGGTLCSLGEKIIGITDPIIMETMANKGNLRNIDLCIGDLFSGTETLDPALTASNLAKANASTTANDWAAGILNLVLEVIGSMTVLACKASGINQAVVTGALATLRTTSEKLADFEKYYGIKFTVADYAGFATAIGAVRHAFMI